MTSRRSLLKRFAAIAAAVAVAPAVKVEAAPAEPPASRYALIMEEYKRGLVSREEFLDDFPELRIEPNRVMHVPGRVVNAGRHTHGIDYHSMSAGGGPVFNHEHRLT